MNYELAKQLKDAGFDQDIVGEWVCDDGSIVCEPPPYGDFAYLPTLEELMEACGKDFLDLKRAGKDLWVARGFDSNNFHIFSDGPTPTEAVARLWLALQK